MNPFCGAVGDTVLGELCRSSRQLLIKRGSSFSSTDISSEALVIRSGVIAAVLSTEKGKSQNIYVALSLIHIWVCRLLLMGDKPI